MILKIRSLNIIPRDTQIFKSFIEVQKSIIQVQKLTGLLVKV